MDATTELVVLLDEAGVEIGSADKARVHSSDTPLHLAFSCHVTGSDGRVLVSRRALTKRTWPGVWTNAFCGHPGPGEPRIDAVHRRAALELGIEVEHITLELPEFRYRATDASGTVENEFCPVYVARTRSVPDPDPTEVAEVAWVAADDLAAAVRLTPWAFSPWLVAQARSLPLLGGAGPVARGGSA